MPAPGFFHNIATRLRLKLDEHEKKRIMSKRKKLDKKLKTLIDIEKKHLMNLKDDAIKETQKVVEPLTKLGFRKEAISKTTAQVARVKATARLDATRVLADEAFKKKDFTTYRALLAKLKKYDKNEKTFSQYIHKAAQQKQSAVTVESIERRIGTYFNDKEEETVRRMIGQQKSQRFALRHPVLTGIPTLGRAPALAERDAKRAVVHSLLRKKLKYQKSLKEKQELDHKRMLEKTRADMPKTITTKAITAAMAAATAGKALSYL